MSKIITLAGAGGKMGCRITDNLVKTRYSVHYLEVSPKGLETLRIRAPHTVNLHVKDFAITGVPCAMGFTVTGRPAGRGMLDVAAVRDAVAVHGRCRTAILETWTPPEPSVADTIVKERRWAEESITYLKTLFGTDESQTRS